MSRFAALKQHRRVFQVKDWILVALYLHTVDSLNCAAAAVMLTYWTDVLGLTGRIKRISAEYFNNYWTAHPAVLYK